MAVRHGQALRTPLTVSLLLCMLLFQPSSTALGTTQTQSESGPMIFDDAGTLAVSVGVSSVGGAALASGTPPKPTPTAEALPNVTVRVRQADGSDLEQVTDDKGQTTFDLAAGDYFVYVPVDAQPNRRSSTPASSEPCPTELWPGTGQQQKSSPRRQAASPSQFCSSYRRSEVD